MTNFRVAPALDDQVAPEPAVDEASVEVETGLPAKVRPQQIERRADRDQLHHRGRIEQRIRCAGRDHLAIALAAQLEADLRIGQAGAGQPVGERHRWQRPGRRGDREQAGEHEGRCQAERRPAAWRGLRTRLAAW
ncbi:MAG: hypothetical protein R3E68_15920 [Burkholderiaceae bacterium]